MIFNSIGMTLDDLYLPIYNWINTIPHYFYDLFRYIQFNMLSFSIQVLITFIICIIVCYLSWKLYFKLKHPFWSIQPVFNIDYWKGWFSPPHTITNDFLKTRFYNTYNIHTIHVQDLSKQNQEYVALLDFYSRLLKNHYITNPNRLKSNKNVKENTNTITKYHPSSNALDLYLSKHIDIPSYISYYFTYEKMKKRIHSILSFYGVTFESLYDNTKHYIYYVDLLCTHKKSRKKGFTPQLIYSSIYNIIHDNKNKRKLNTFLFKRENTIHGFVPFVQYPTYMYCIKFWNSVLDIRNLKPIEITEITTSNFELFVYAMDKIKSSGMFPYSIVSNFTKLKDLVENNKYHLYILHYKSEIYSLYVFKDADYIYKNHKTVEFVSCYIHSEEEKHLTLFFDVFYHIVNTIKERNQYNYILIDNIAHIPHFSNWISKQYRKEYSFISSLYLYNYAHKTINYKELFICM